MATEAEKTGAIRLALHALVTEVRSTQDVQKFLMDVERWKRRSVEQLSGFVPAADLASFRKASVTASLFADDPLASVIDEHRAALESLIGDMERNPDHYGPDKVAATPTAPRKHLGANTPTLKMPEKVTLSWLKAHVPVSTWLLLVGLMVAVFLAGFRLGMSRAALVVAPIAGESIPERSAPIRPSVTDSVHRPSSRDTARGK
jgi:hypothetical protein